MAPANQLRLSFTGSEDGEAKTETCRAAKPLWRTTTRTSGPRGLNLLNRPMRTRTSGAVAGESGRPLPLCQLILLSSNSDLSHSAVHVDFHAGNVRRILRSQERHGTSHFFGLSEPLHRHLGNHFLREFVDGFLREPGSPKDRRNNWSRR